MKGSELLSLWKSTDNSKLTPKQISIRLPFHVAAKVAALCEMLPNKTRTEIIGDVMSSALEDLENSFEFVAGRALEIGPETDQEYREDSGQRARFNQLTEKYLAELEKEIGDTKLKD